MGIVPQTIEDFPPADTPIPPPPELKRMSAHGQSSRKPVSLKIVFWSMKCVDNVDTRDLYKSCVFTVETIESDVFLVKSATETKACAVIIGIKKVATFVRLAALNQHVRTTPESSFAFADVSLGRMAAAWSRRAFQLTAESFDKCVDEFLPFLGYVFEGNFDLYCDYYN